MNKNLKTLKDITLQYNPNHTSGEPIVCSIDSLKRIAREWIKDLDSKIEDYEDSDVSVGFLYQKAWIKEFFNLEDD